jgi:hypothetical protein
LDPIAAGILLRDRWRDYPWPWLKPVQILLYSPTLCILGSGRFLNIGSSSLNATALFDLRGRKLLIAWRNRWFLGYT